MFIKSLMDLNDEEKKKLAVLIAEGVRKMLKDTVEPKEIKEIKEDIEQIVKKEILKNKAFFKILFEKEDIKGFYYIRVNEKEKFLKPFFETEFFYSVSPNVFFHLMQEAKNDLKKMKNIHNDVLSYVGYYTVDDNIEEELSHAKLSNKRIEEVFGENMKPVFKTFALKRRI